MIFRVLSVAIEDDATNARPSDFAKASSHKSGCPLLADLRPGGLGGTSVPLSPSEEHLHPNRASYGAPIYDLRH